MYSNIDLDHAFEIMKHWLDLVPPDQQNDFPREAILDTLNLVMRYNIMQFGDRFLLQLVGTAMGTSVAVIFVNLTANS